MLAPYATATDLSTFITLATKLIRSWTPALVWFRGHRCVTHELVPTLYRHPSFHDEASAFNVFWARGRGLQQFDRLDPGDYWDWYFAARHHTLPSRLLDWSANALVALYFATEAPSPLERAAHETMNPARVWLLDPMAMNKSFFQQEAVFIPNDRDPKAAIHQWLPSKLQRSRKKHAVAIYPSSTNQRLIAQQGMFTVHGRARDSLEAQLCAGNNSPRLACIDVERSAVPEIRAQLSWLGMNQFAVEADADGLSDHLVDFARSEKRHQLGRSRRNRR